MDSFYSKDAYIMDFMKFKFKCDFIRAFTIHKILHLKIVLFATQIILWCSRHNRLVINKWV